MIAEIKKRIGFFIDNYWVFSYVALGLLMLLFMFYQCGKQSFWLDEMSLLGTITKDKGIGDILNQYLTIDGSPVVPDTSGK